MTTVCSVDIRRQANFAGLMPEEKIFCRTRARGKKTSQTSFQESKDISDIS